MIAQHRVIWWLCHHLFSMRQTYLEPHFNGLKPGLRCPCVLQCNSMASRMSGLLILLLVSLCVPSSESLKVFSFERTQEAGDNSSSLTFATLDSTTTEALPPRFRCPIVSSSGIQRLRTKQRWKRIGIQALYPQICAVLVSQAGRLGPEGGFPHVWRQTSTLGYNQVRQHLVFAGWRFGGICEIHIYNIWGLHSFKPASCQALVLGRRRHCWPLGIFPNGEVRWTWNIPSVINLQFAIWDGTHCWYFSHFFRENQKSDISEQFLKFQ